MGRPHAASRTTSLVAAPALVALVALLATACGGAGGPADPPSDAAPEASASATEPEPVSAPRAPLAVGTPLAPPRLRPVRISAPTIGVDAAMSELGIDRRGRIEVPADADEAGWLRTSPAPGQQGPAVVAGHVDSDTGPAVFYRLGELEVGDPVSLIRRDGTTATFTVDGVRTYRQDRFPTRQVYGPVPGPALRLLTCAGDYDESRGGYQSNVVVYAS